MSKNQKMLFVCGAPRSGTTGMQALLTADHRIVMGMERYGSYLNDEFGTQLFTKARFFDFESDPRDLKRSRPYYEEVAKDHFDSAEYIGDKIPLLYLEFERVTKVYPEAKFVVLLRNIIDICNSYQNRKDDPNDDWSLDVNDAITHWNQLLDFIRLRGRDSRIKLVIYEDFYKDIQQYEDLYTFLNLGFDDGLRVAYRDIVEKTARLEERRKTALSDAQKLLIYKRANFQLYQAILNNATPLVDAPVRDVKHLGKSRDPMPLDESDLLAAFRIFLGRGNVNKDELAAFSSMDGRNVMSKIFASSEFQENAFNRELITSLAKQIRDQLAKAPASQSH